MQKKGEREIFFFLFLHSLNSRSKSLGLFAALHRGELLTSWCGILGVGLNAQSRREIFIAALVFINYFIAPSIVQNFIFFITIKKLKFCSILFFLGITHNVQKSESICQTLVFVIFFGF